MFNKDKEYHIRKTCLINNIKRDYQMDVIINNTMGTPVMGIEPIEPI